MAKNMRVRACEIVSDYVVEHIDKTDKVPVFQVYIVWQCKTLQNWKFLISTDIPDGMYYELTYNGDKKRMVSRCLQEVREPLHP